MDERATGLIMRTRPLTETSLIVHWITPEFGRIATVAKGARRPKSAFRGKLDLFHKANFTFLRSRRGDLHNLREVQLETAFPNLRKDLNKLNLASHAVTLIEQNTEAETPVETVSHVFESFLKHLDASPPHALSSPAFELKLLAELGLTPDLAQSTLQPGTQALCKRLLDFDWDQLMRLAASPAQVREIQRYLHAFMIYHLDRAPRRSVGED